MSTPGNIEIRAQTPDEQIAVLTRRIARLEEELKKASKAAKQVAKDGDEATNSLDQGFESALNSAKGFVAGALSIGAVVGVVKQLKEEVLELAKAQAEASKGIGALGQLAGGNPAELERLIGLSRQFYASGAAPSLGAAADMVFGMRSAGMDDAPTLSLFGDIARAQLADVASMLGPLSQVRAATGQDGGETFGQAIAGSQFTKIDASALTDQFSRAVAQIESMGLKFEDVATAVTRVAQVRPAEAGSYVNALIRAMGATGLADEMRQDLGRPATINEYLEHIRSLDMSIEELGKYLGSSEAKTAFDLLTNAEGLEMTARIRAELDAASVDNVRRLIETNLARPEIAGTLGQAQATASLELQRMQGATNAQNLEAVRAMRERELRESLGGFGASIQGFFDGAAELLAGGLSGLTQGDYSIGAIRSYGGAETPQYSFVDTAAEARALEAGLEYTPKPTVSLTDSQRMANLASEYASTGAEALLVEMRMLNETLRAVATNTRDTADLAGKPTAVINMPGESVLYNNNVE